MSGDTIPNSLLFIVNWELAIEVGDSTEELEICFLVVSLYYDPVVVCPRRSVCCICSRFLDSVSRFKVFSFPFFWDFSWWTIDLHRWWETVSCWRYCWTLSPSKINTLAFQWEFFKIMVSDLQRTFGNYRPFWNICCKFLGRLSSSDYKLCLLP